MSKKKKTDIAAEWTDLKILKPWEDNPRVNDHVVDEVRSSIERFGFGAPIIARREDNRIIAGHTRAKAAEALGMDLVPVRFLDLTHEQASALALADNKIAEHAFWDMPKLNEILESLSTSNDIDGTAFDITGLGWTEKEIEMLLDSGNEEEVKWHEYDENMDDDAPDGATAECPECGHRFKV